MLVFMQEATSSVDSSCDAGNQEKRGASADLKKKRSFPSNPIAKTFSFLSKNKGDKVCGDPDKPTKEDIKRWARSFDDLLHHPHGLMLFRLFLQREFSDENIEFWMACEAFKQMKTPEQFHQKASEIYRDFVAIRAPKEVNLDSATRDMTMSNLENPNNVTFDQAQARIQSLMEKDSYPRFLKSDLYLDLVKKL